jgi:uncharacterized NAD(P)/FAD-binding protein YdhS
MLRKAPLLTVNRMHTIAILGAGFSGTLVAVHLLRVAAGRRVRVVLVDRTGAFGPGLAYGNGSESLLLNVVAGRMSALPDEPGDFLKWARGVDPSVRGEMFLPRRMYGRYLAQLLDRAAADAGPGVVLERVADEAVDVRHGGGGLEVVLRRSGVVLTDDVVLAPGNFAPVCPAWCGDDVRASGAYIGDPWRGAALTSVGPADRVLIVGTGLTMMDVALSLAEAGHRGRIDAVSRRGLLSQAHRHGNPGLAKLPDPLFSRTFTSVRELLKVIRCEARRVEAMGGDWRDVVNALRSVTPSLWGALDERERRRFLEHVAPFWNTHRHRAPQSVAAGIERLTAEGRLAVHSARVIAARVGPGGGVEVELAPRGGTVPGDVLRLVVDRVINCTGPTTDAARSGNVVVESLLRAGMVRPGPLGMGLDFDDEGHVVRADGGVEERVYLMGPARIGRLWETTAVPELRVQARELAARLVGDPRPAGVKNGLPAIEVKRDSAARAGA